MKLDLKPFRPSPAPSAYVPPTFGAEDPGPMAPELRERLRRPMLVGAGVIAVFVVGLGLWASFNSLASGITAGAAVRADSQRKTLRHKETGIVKQILVKEGQQVRAGQPLLLFNDVEARAAVDVLQNQYDTLLAQNARYTAEALGRTSLELPPELTARMGEAGVATIIRDQQFLFTTRQQLFQSQSAVLMQRIEQQETQIQGAQAQLDSIVEQQRLTEESSRATASSTSRASRRRRSSCATSAAWPVGGRRASSTPTSPGYGSRWGDPAPARLVAQRTRHAVGRRSARQPDQAVRRDPRLTTARQTLASTVVRARWTAMCST